MTSKKKQYKKVIDLTLPEALTVCLQSFFKADAKYKLHILGYVAGKIEKHAGKKAMKAFEADAAEMIQSLGVIAALEESDIPTHQSLVADEELESRVKCVDLLIKEFYKAKHNRN